MEEMNMYFSSSFFIRVNDGTSTYQMKSRVHQLLMIEQSCIRHHSFFLHFVYIFFILINFFRFIRSLKCIWIMFFFVFFLRITECNVQWQVSSLFVSLCFHSLNIFISSFDALLRTTMFSVSQNKTVNNDYLHLVSASSTFNVENWFADFFGFGNKIIFSL